MSQPTSYPNRRDVLAASAAAGALNALPTGMAQAAESSAIRPFHFTAADEALVDLRRRIAATRWPDRETVNDTSQGVQLATMQAARALLGDRLRLAQGRGEAQRLPALHHRDRRARHPFHSRPLEDTRTRCR